MEKAKGKRGVEEEEEEEEEWLIVRGVGHCMACVKENTLCQINLVVIRRWRKEFEDRVNFQRAPLGINCQQCSEIWKKKCELPATVDMRKGLELAAKKPKVKEAKPTWSKGKAPTGSFTPLVASSSKRRSEFLGVELLAKRRRLGEVDGEGGMSAALTEVLRWLQAMMARQAESTARAVDGLSCRR
jgi:hypothetical protein